MMATILEFAATAIQLITTASDMRRRFFQYGMCLVLLLVGAGFLIIAAGFLTWALYEGLSAGVASPNGARLILCFVCAGLAGGLILAAKKMIN